MLLWDILLLQVELIPIRVSKLADPFPPFHLLWSGQESDALCLHARVVFNDVIREESDTGRSWLGVAVLESAKMNPCNRPW
jgi:hypothetical protein